MAKLTILAPNGDAQLFAPLTTDTPKTLRELDRIYAQRFKPANTLESSLVFELACIHRDLDRILALTLRLELAQTPCDSQLLESLFRRECRLTRRRSAIVKALSKGSPFLQGRKRTKMSIVCSKLNPTHEPRSNPVGLRSNPIWGSNEPMKRDRMDPAA